MDSNLASVLAGVVASLGVTAVKQDNWPDWAKLLLPYLLAVVGSGVMGGLGFNAADLANTALAPGAAAVTYSVTKNGRIEALLQSVVNLLWKGTTRTL